MGSFSKGGKMEGNLQRLRLYIYIYTFYLLHVKKNWLRFWMGRLLEVRFFPTVVLNR